MTHEGVELLRTLIPEEMRTGPVLSRRQAMHNGAADSPAPDGVTVEASTLAGMACEWLTPADVPESPLTILYLHGGGYCMGNLDTHRSLAGLLALAARSRVVTIDYRLAPEHRHPAPIEDAVSAWRELLKENDPDRLALAGDSAGGGLALATLVALRDGGEPLPRATALISPWVDLTQTAPSHVELDGLDPLIGLDGLNSLAENYLNGTDARTTTASPLFADLAGLTPIHISVGDQEVLLDDSRGLAGRLAAANVEHELTVWPDLCHVFQIFPEDIIPESPESIREIARFLTM